MKRHGLMTQRTYSRRWTVIAVILLILGALLIAIEPTALDAIFGMR